MADLRQRNKHLKGELQDKRAMCKELQGQLQQAQQDWSAAAADQEQLLAHVHSLRHSLEVTYAACCQWKRKGRVVKVVAE